MVFFVIPHPGHTTIWSKNPANTKGAMPLLIPRKHNFVSAFVITKLKFYECKRMPNAPRYPLPKQHSGWESANKWIVTTERETQQMNCANRAGNSLEIQFWELCYKPQMDGALVTISAWIVPTLVFPGHPCGSAPQTVWNTCFSWKWKRWRMPNHIWPIMREFAKLLKKWWPAHLHGSSALLMLAFPLFSKTEDWLCYYVYTAWVTTCGCPCLRIFLRQEGKLDTNGCGLSFEGQQNK